MELVFREDKLEYLSKILCRTVTLEQTADVIVPDSLPDCERVVDAFGTLLVRSEECTAGAASVSGMVQAGVLFVTEDGAVERLETQIPFSACKELTDEQDECRLQCRCALRSVDARMLNSRKLLLRVGISCTLTVYAPKTCAMFDIPEPSPSLQLKRTRLPLRMPVGMGEKAFPLNEELELPVGKSAVSRLLKCLCSAQVAEQKTVGNKAVFKGTVRVHALYADGEDALLTHDWELPFSQYAELERESDDCDVETALSLTSFDVEPESMNDCRRLFLSANVLAQCTAVGQREVTLIEDAFCTDAELKPAWQECALCGVLDRQTFRETATVQAEESARAVVDAWMYPGEAETQREDGQLRVDVPLMCNVMYYDETGELQGTTLRTAVSAQTELSENGNCAVAELCAGEVLCGTGGGLTVRMPLALTLECSAEHRLRGICGGEIEPLAAEQGRRPAVILRRTDSEEEVWEIAKHLRTPMEAIIEANELNGPTVPANTMLLIPT